MIIPIKNKAIVNKGFCLFHNSVDLYLLLDIKNYKFTNNLFPKHHHFIDVTLVGLILYLLSATNIKWNLAMRVVQRDNTRSIGMYLINSERMCTLYAHCYLNFEGL